MVTVYMTCHVWFCIFQIGINRSKCESTKMCKQSIYDCIFIGTLKIQWWKSSSRFTPPCSISSHPPSSFLHLSPGIMDDCVAEDIMATPTRSFRQLECEQTRHRHDPARHVFSEETSPLPLIDLFFFCFFLRVNNSSCSHQGCESWWDVGYNSITHSHPAALRL